MNCANPTQAIIARSHGTVSYTSVMLQYWLTGHVDIKMDSATLWLNSSIFYLKDIRTQDIVVESGIIHTSPANRMNNIVVMH